jgi:hypothetical protein
VKTAQISKIVTRRNLNLSDFLAILVLNAVANENIPVEYTNPDNPKLEEYVRNPKVALVGIGGKYEPDLLNFDNQQNNQLPTPFPTVLRHFDDENDPAMMADELIVQIIDYLSKYGLKSAITTYGLAIDSTTQDKLEKLVRLDLNTSDKDRLVNALVQGMIAAQFLVCREIHQKKSSDRVPKHLLALFIETFWAAAFEDRIDGWIADKQMV